MRSDLRRRVAAVPAAGRQNQTVPRRDGESGEANVHAAWRLALAERAARVYASNHKLAALTAAGSVGTGLADRFSDLELDCYWFDPPSDGDRSGPIHVLGGELEVLWDYDQDEQEWSDDYRLGDLGVTVSSFLVSTIDRFIGDVVLRADTDPVKHMRMAALCRCRPLHGPELISSWRRGRLCTRARSSRPWSSGPSARMCSRAGRTGKRWPAGETIWRSKTCSAAPGTRCSARSWRSTASTHHIAWSNGRAT